MDFEEGLSLDTICQGAAKEMFDHEMLQILANISDINTDVAKPRRITLTFDFKPLSDRSGASISLGVNSKLVPVSAFKSTIFIGKGQDGKPMAYSVDTKQETLYPKDNPDKRVVTLKK